MLLTVFHESLAGIGTMSDFPDDKGKQLKKISKVPGNSHKFQKDMTLSNALKLVISR